MAETAIPEAETARQEAPAAPKKASRRQWLFYALKGGLSIALLGYIARIVLGQRGGEGMLDALRTLRWEWIAIGLGIHLVGVSANVLRWRTLLRGQGIHAPWRFLVGSLLIARFFGAVTPGGFTGFGGWRIYDVGRHTGKWARATATIVVETIVGWLAFASVVMLGSLFGARFIGTSGVALVNAGCVGLLLVGLALVVRPVLFRTASRFVPGKIRPRLQTFVDALQAYQGRGAAIALALGCAIVVHTTHFLIYVCTAQALGVTQVGVGEVFFGSSLQVLSTLLPASINGVGLREMTAVALYTSEGVGVPLALAVLIPVLGFAVEMCVSVLGAPIFLARRGGYAPAVTVDDPDREMPAQAAIELAPESAWPTVRRGLELGLGAGALAGLLVGIAEGIAVVVQGHGRTGPWVIAYGAIAYAVFFLLAGAVSGALAAWSGRAMRRAALPEGEAWAHWVAFFVAACAFGLTAFRIRRDVFDEELRWASLPGLGVLLGCLVGAAILALALDAVLRAVARRTTFVLRPAGSPAVVAGAIAILVPVTLAIGDPSRANATGPVTATAPDGAGNVLVIVVDTLRADHLRAYGYERGETPNLDAFAEDAIRFDEAFSNASWTRPSFASILTGRYPSGHGVMSKSSALPADVVTMPEAFFASGWHTGGVVTNYNIAPYFNFDQGFVEYRYLEPDFVMGADDAAAKLLLVQFLRQRLFEPMRDRIFGVQPGVAYQDAAEVNRALLEMIDAAPTGRPWMMFAGYMDPHDPYYAHPYDGTAYSRAAHPSPDPSEAAHLTELYDGEITYWDQHFGELLGELRRRGVYDSTTIVVTADHGEELGDHGGFWHGTTLYDEQVHVPLFVRLPGGRRAGTTVRHWVQSIDLMPTLLSEAGVEIPPGVAGASLFEGSDRLFAEESHEGNVLSAVRERRADGDVKLITTNAGNPRGLPETELFRVDVDPGEMQDLSRSEAALLESARAALDAAAAEAAADAVAGAEVELGDDERRQLCALGYEDHDACCRDGLLPADQCE